MFSLRNLNSKSLGISPKKFRNSDSNSKLEVVGIAPVLPFAIPWVELPHSTSRWSWVHPLNLLLVLAVPTYDPSNWGDAQIEKC